MKDWDPLKLKKLVLSPLPVDFYRRNTLQVAQSLLGKILVVRSNPQYEWDHPRAQVTAGRIVETEAYRGDDPASHSARGETPRNSVMFGEPGVAYIYFIYGMYEMLNFVTEPKGSPGAVLIRALEPLYGVELMASRRGRESKARKDLTSGPGKLCRAMGIEMSHNGQLLQGPALSVCDDGKKPHSISESKRVGIRLGTEKLWRFFITENPYVSRAPQNSTAQLLALGSGAQEIS